MKASSMMFIESVKLASELAKGSIADAVQVREK